MNPAFGGFYQNAYITTDLDKAMRVFKDTYGVPSFFVFDADYEVRYRGEQGRLNLKIGLANLNGVQIELIEAREGCIDLYREKLPTEGFGISHHHVAAMVHGDHDRYRQWRSTLEDGGRKVAMEAELGDFAAFLYVDDRATLGHYTEYLWSRDPGALNAMIPYFDQTT